MAYQPKPGRFFRSGRSAPQQNRNARSALGEPRAQAVYYGVWLTGIGIGAILFVILVVFLGNNAGSGASGQNKRNIQTGVENQGAEVAPVVFTTDGQIASVQKLLADISSNDAAIKKAAQDGYNGALARGQTNYQRICIGCHYGPPEATSNGPWIGNLYQTAALYNGKPMNDANVVTFILLGSQSHNLNDAGNGIRKTTDNADPSQGPRPLAGGWNPMPAGIATPQQAVDIMLYLKQQTCPKNKDDAAKIKACSQS